MNLQLIDSHSLSLSDTLFEREKMPSQAKNWTSYAVTDVIFITQGTTGEVKWRKWPNFYVQHILAI